ncbi:MAG: hypothetical protein IJJ00_04855 [Erysipelotrichaceae bacterium]|nr:hypothetical protein [Erysipelotrichaceae bacterium]
MDRPIYVVTGFLDSGKTMSIKRTLVDPRFTEEERTLILCFEEGDEVYEEAFLKATRSEVEYLDYKDFNKDVINDLDKKHGHPDRIFIEFNGMDDDRTLLNMELPGGWEFAQMICLIDASKFRLHVANMAQFMFNHVSSTEIVVLNRYEGQDFRYLRNNIKSMNQGAMISLEDENGIMHDLPVDDLFDPDNLNISDADYGLFCMDVTDNCDRYLNKEIKFNGFFLETVKGDCVFGRYAMVCCANDLQCLAIRVKGLKDVLILGEYYHIEGTLKAEKARGYYMLYVEGKSARKIDKPAEEYVSFS